MALKDDIILVVALLIVFFGLSSISLLLYASLRFVEQIYGMDVALTIGLSSCIMFPYIYILCRGKRVENVPR